ncbi:MAG: hypothetical protein ABW131_06570, partial [Candidatus Sedimenticola sp. 6PFRAG5]
DKEAISPQIDVVDGQLSDLLAGLSQLDVPDSGKGGGSGVSGEELDVLLDELSELLEENDTGASRCLEKIQAHLKDKQIGEYFSQIDQSIAEYDFDSALEQLNRAVEAIRRQV